MKEKSLTQKAVAEACGMSYNTFRRWLSKDVIPPLDVAISLSECLEINLEFLIRGRKQDSPARISREVQNMLKRAGEKLRSAM